MLIVSSTTECKLNNHIDTHSHKDSQQQQKGLEKILCSIHISPQHSNITPETILNHNQSHL